MPPVMGAAAFICEYLGVPYSFMVTAFILPYYTCIIMDQY